MWLARGEHHRARRRCGPARQHVVPDRPGRRDRGDLPQDPSLRRERGGLRLPGVQERDPGRRRSSWRTRDRSGSGCRSATTCGSPSSSGSRRSRGATVVTLPSAFTAPTGQGSLGAAAAGSRDREPGVRDRARPARASTPKLQWHGRSMIVDPWGVVLAQAPDTRVLHHRGPRPRGATGCADPHPEPHESPPRRRTTGRRNDDLAADLVRVPAGTRRRRARTARRGRSATSGCGSSTRRRSTATSGSRSRRSPSTTERGRASAPRCSSPGLRHPLTQAERDRDRSRQLAPGRVVVAIGTGFTGRMALGQPALPWARHAHLHRAGAWPARG